ncbi:MAG: fluoride efflux transporter CrcB [Prevotella sp.]
MREFFIVGMGSFLGGSSRYAVSQMMKMIFGTTTPLGTLTVNIVGCFLIGLFSAWSADSRWLSPSLRLILITGFCGGFTTFSTFMNENATMLRGGDYALFGGYFSASLLLGFAALIGGHYLVRIL